MKKYLRPVLVLAASICLSSCIDIMQHITRLADGTDQNTIRITVSKALFEMSGSMSGENVDYDDFFKSGDFGETDIGEYNKYSAKIEKINTDTDIGWSIDLNLNYGNKEMADRIYSEKTPFIPKYYARYAAILIGMNENRAFGDTASDKMAAAFLSGAKYRILIDKSCISTISRAALKTGDRETEIGFIDLYNEYLIEIPLPVILNGFADLVLYY